MRTILAALLALAVAVPVAFAGDAQVSIKDYMFSPMTITVPAGTKVVWTNNDDSAHSVKSADAATPFASEPLEHGQTYARVFDKAGTYHVLCGLHPYMKETIVVQ